MEKQVCFSHKHTVTTDTESYSLGLKHDETGAETSDASATSSEKGVFCIYYFLFQSKPPVATVITAGDSQPSTPTGPPAAHADPYAPNAGPTAAIGIEGDSVGTSLFFLPSHTHTHTKKQQN